ncbi:MAG: T9SS type A sorting domain-containing protein [Bacteroidetes bacterium]|nr:T9SS type A sorting domain-containing protein [Bacteroidota bacterium]
MNVIVTGIASNAAQVVSIYPNPSNGVFTLNINNAASNQVVISIMDIQGKVVYSESDKNVSAQYNKQINLTNLAKGIYYVKLNIGSEVQIQKLIIQ